MPDPSPEVIRTDPDGTPVHSDWSEKPAESPSAKVEEESRHWAARQAETITARLAQLEEARRLAEELMNLPPSALLAGVERWYSAAETARFFSRSPAWIYDRIGNHKFRYTDGTEIIPFTDGDDTVKRPRYRFNLPLIREIALSCYRSGTIKWEDLQVVMNRIAQAHLGEVVNEEEDT